MKKLAIISVLVFITAVAWANFGGKTVVVELESFNTGKVSPRMEARENFPKYSSACRTLENFFISPLGPVYRRPGTRYIATAKTGTPRLISFEYSTDDVYVIEMGDEYMRFYRNNAQIMDPEDSNNPYEIETVFDSSELSAVRYAMQDNYMYLVDGNDPPQKLTRSAHDAWTIADANFAENPPLKGMNTNQESFITPSGVTGSITLEATDDIFDSDQIGETWELIQTADSNSTSGKYTTVGTHTSSSVLVFDGQTYSASTSNSWIGTFTIQRSYDDGSTWRDVKPFTYEDDGNLLYRGIENHDDAYYRVQIVITDIPDPHTLIGSATAGCLYNLSTDEFDRHGLVQITGVTDGNTATATVIRRLANTSATWRWTEGAFSDFNGWPKTVCFHQQRTVYGGSDAYPTTLWFSATGHYDKFRYGANDDDAFSVTLQGQNPIRWLLSGDYLLIGTSSSVGKYGEKGQAITPTTPAYQEQSLNGSADIQAIVAGDSVIYVERGARKIRNLGYNLQYDRYVTPDLTLMSEEITDPCVVEIHYQARPQPIVWCVLGDGQLATLFYHRDQAVVAWSRQITSGDYKSLIAVPGAGTTPAGDRWREDAVWTVAERTVDSNSVTYIEEMMPVEWGSDDDYAWFVDSGLINLTAQQDANYYAGLGHLAGKTVGVYADSNYIGDFTVDANGLINTGSGHTNVIAGLNYTSKLETLPLKMPPEIRNVRTSNRKINAINFDLYRSYYLQYGMGGNSALETVDFNDIVTNEVTFSRAVFPFGSLSKPTIYVQTDKPVPLQIRAMIPEITYYRND